LPGSYLPRVELILSAASSLTQAPQYFGRHQRKYMSAWLSFADALAVADAICEAARERGANW